MLQELHITNFALIEHLHLTFGTGLNILTGETGAGKSIVIDALGLTLGERSSGGEEIRAGTDKALVEAVFDLTGAPDPVCSRLAENGLESDDGLLLISREITRSGKSSCRINGRLVPLSTLKLIADGLVDIHGQHDHQALLHADRHIDILDQWCGPDVAALRKSVGEKGAVLADLRRQLESLLSNARERVRTLDLYRFQQQEIDSAKLTASEEGDLSAERNRLANAEKLAASAQEAYTALSGEGRTGGVLDSLNTALSTIQQAASIDEKLAPAIESLTGAISFAEDASHSLRDYRDSIEANPERLEEIEARMELLRTLKRKYGETLMDVLAYGQELTSKLDQLENAEALGDELTTLIIDSEKEVARIAENLTKARRAAGEAFAPRIMRELADLGMASTRFEVSITPQLITSRGADKVEFLLSANPGEPLRPLARIASGGEMSRIMLAMKSVLVRAGSAPVMIFDEVDVGVGGRAAQTIADKLDTLAEQAQILCITHLPQIASRADTHFAIEKSIEDTRTVVTVHSLSEEGRVEEIARMLGGARRTEAVLRHAQEMLATRVERG